MMSRLVISLAILCQQALFVQSWNFKIFRPRSNVLHSIRNVRNDFNDKAQNDKPISWYRNIKSDTAIMFKLSENEVVETEESKEKIEFDDMGGGTVMQKLAKGMPIVAAGLGFALVPSSGVALRIAGAAVGGIAGVAASKAILKKLETDSGSGGFDDFSFERGGGGGVTVSPMVLDALYVLDNGLQPPISMDMDTLEELARKARVSEDDLSEFFTHAFAQVILSSIKQSDTQDLTELSEVIDYANSMELTPSEIGDGFSIAACKIGRDIRRDDRGFFEENIPSEVLLQAMKLFFLADKMIGSDGFYGKRLAIAISFFTQEELKEKVSKACSTLFKRVIESILSNPDAFTVDEMNTMKEFLNTSVTASALRPAVMQNMIMEGLQLVLSNSLTDKSALDAKIENYDLLKKSQSVLGWNSIEFDRTLETKTLPVFEEAAKTIVHDVVKRPDLAENMGEVLKERMISLNIEPRKAKAIITSLVSHQNDIYMNQIDRVYNASGGAIEPAFKIMAAYTDTHAALQKLTEPMMDGMKIPLPGN